MDTEEQPQKKSFIAIAIIGVVATLLIAYVAWTSGQDRLKLELESAASERARAINAALNTELEFLNLIRVYFKAAEKITESSFRQLVGSMRIEHPAAQAIMWAPLISHEQRQQIETQMRQQSPDFEVYESTGGFGTKRADQRNTYLPILYMQSPNGIERTGFDLSSQKEFIPSLAQARNLGVITFSDTLDVQSGEQVYRGIVAFAPFYEGEPMTNAARQKALKGYFVAAFQLDVLVEKALADFPRDYIQFELIAERESADPEVLYTQRYKNTALNPYDLTSVQPVLERKTERWVIVVKPGAAFNSSAPWVTALVICILGFMATFLALRHLLISGNQTQVIRELVKRRTDQLKAAQKKLETKSRTDPLTGLHNRRYLDEVLEREWALAIRGGGELAIALIDVDHFKNYNDHYGHPAGDKVLRNVGNILAASFRRPNDLVARYGGEEFMAVMANCEGAESHLKELVESFAQVNIPHERSSTASHLTISIGLVLCQPKVGDSLQVAVLQADRALYIAKNDGRNRVETWAQNGKPLNTPLGNTQPTAEKSARFKER